ncbi:proton-conducting transporter membrane subunit [Desulfotomaculum copahuensis]|uniref:NADH:quinone oxidoreductase/Mrp antiporter transmembrane domain-containing protein n=1 Tax=Desulfotomaculum copahuensis TaxID=1838280 RepID=A0A1B7LIM6_9FIRM|nr:proton-conducting transporter membrane subunit [Desulfotomaculum copahuensis]OAT86428.1 hypothetical protein A6M21_03105 [Desulfotomaculum copahuensis]
MTGQTWLLIMTAVSLLGALLMAVVTGGRAAVVVSMGAAVLASLFGLAGAVTLALAGSGVFLAAAVLPPLGTLLLRPDGLSLLFFVLTMLIWLFISIFSLDYLQKFIPRYNVRGFGALYNILFLALAVTTLAGDLVTFLIAWEVMTALSYLLIVFEHRNPETTKAGFFMLVMSETGSVLLIAAFIMLRIHTGHFDFAGIAAAAASLPAAVKNAVFILALLGFGVKVGIVPLYGWFPPAYAAAPANVAAVLSGVTLSLGVYGLCRVILDLPGAAPLWWGLVLLVLGALTAILGILYALMEQNLKRMLSLSSVENTGLILVGLGAAMVYRTGGLYVLAALAAITALYHTINHAVYKTLLFLGAGAVEFATGRQDMDGLGGLSRTMPYTTLFFLVGSLSIAALPPFNGFVSEWLTLQTLLLSFHLPDVLPRVVMAAAGVILALTAALAITCFVKACGTTFLGRARRPEAARAREAGPCMKLGMALPAVACLLLGVLPTLVIPRLNGPASILAGGTAAQQMVPAVFSQPEKFKDLVMLGGGFLRGILPAPGAVVVPTDPGFSSISPTYLLVALPLMLLLGAALARIFGGRTVQEKGPVWAGGEERFDPAQQYTGTAYSNPVLVLFGSIYRPRVDLVRHYHAQNNFRLATGYQRQIYSPAERYLYRPAVWLLYKGAGLLSWIQSGRVNQYVAYMLLLLAGALIYAVW